MRVSTPFHRIVLIGLLSFFCSARAVELPVSISGRVINTESTNTQREFNLRSNKTKVIVFMASLCPCSSSHESLLADIAKEFSEFEFIGVHSNANESESEASKHFLAAHLPFSIIQDTDAKIADQFGALKTPHVFIVNPKGELLYSGGVTDVHIAAKAKKQYLRDALTSLKEGKLPNPREVRTLGCVISRK